jgi:hypothetical protein
MISNIILKSDKKLDYLEIINELDCTSYLSAPNLVNCTNKHVGDCFRFFCQFKESDFKEKIFFSLSKLIFLDKIFSKKENLKSIRGHHLLYSIINFDVITGKPKNYEIIKKWPNISYISYGSSNETPNTFISIINLIKDTFIGNINLDHFWKIFNFFEDETNYKLKEFKNYNENFKIEYISNYSTIKYQKFVSKKNDLKNRHLIFLKNIESKLDGLINDDNFEIEFQNLIFMIIEIYEIEKNINFENIIKIKDNFQNKFEIDDLRNILSELLQKYENSYSILINKF